MNAAKTTAADATIKAALALLKSGEISQGEAATLAGVSRQLVRYWCRRAAIDAPAARAARLARLWAKHRG